VPALRAVLDTNVLLSGIAYPASVPGKLIAAWRHGALDVVLSDYILDELRRVLPRLAHRHGLGADEIDDLIDGLALQADPIRSAPRRNSGPHTAAFEMPMRSVGYASRTLQSFDSQK